MPTSQSRVAQYIRTQLALCGKSQTAVAAELGYANPNIITMFKQGKTRVPIGTCGRLSKALGVDPAHLLRLVLKEYEPALYETIENVLARQSILTVDELVIIAAIRAVAADRMLDLTEPWAASILASSVALIAETTARREAAAIAALERLPSNMRNR